MAGELILVSYDEYQRILLRATATPNADVVASSEARVDHYKLKTAKYKRELKRLHRTHRLLALEYRELKRKYDSLLRAMGHVQNAADERAFEEREYEQSTDIELVIGPDGVLYDRFAQDDDEALWKARENG